MTLLVEFALQQQHKTNVVSVSQHSTLRAALQTDVIVVHIRMKNRFVNFASKVQKE
mgnify:CR=1 FL=1